ncbi:alpha/beta hydrolase [Streptomyces sp. ME19-01-6]|uniref:alpha/beta hydrolase n=1 Tax=Streptomyces sp. ME19-01-6 TaxID=3028686 RepID=UPI0029B63F7F|nr:alpha/beta hydrolase [Streptomyces sp. ME19-01-6]MDX3226773.1 alpha/beta hydrolase [Streptomyces sp. ME19-01-6]
MFTFPVAPDALLHERTRQFTALGIPGAVVARARSRIGDMWGTGKDGWVPVWAAEAERAHRAGDPLLASLCWGAARFPCLATADRTAAHERQLDAYLHAAPRFPVRFERRVLDVPESVPVHLFQRRRMARPGIVILSGGVDTWKMDLHRLAVATALATGLLVAAVDMPGTGESTAPLSPEADQILTRLVAELRRLYQQPIGFHGISFGGHWAAKLALGGHVDAAIDLGGPTGASGSRIDIPNLPCGMAGIIGNALHLDAMPETELIDDLLARFSLREQGVLDQPGGSPLLAVNGADDPYIPLGDTTGLAGRPGTTVWVVKDATHCAPERFAPVTLAAWGWLTARLAPGRPLPRLAEATARQPLRPFLAPPTTCEGAAARRSRASSRPRTRGRLRPRARSADPGP